MQTDSSASWDQSLTALAAPPPLLQSWGWGEIQARSGWKVDRITLPGGGRCTVLRQRVGPWTWAYVPRGPVPATEAALVDLLDWAKHQRLTRLRIEPERGPDFRQVLERLGLRPASSVQPQHTLILNLRPEEQMLARFRANHRHSLRTADRREVEVVEGAEIAVIDDLARSTATRQQIHLPGGGYFRLLDEHLASCQTYVARVAGKPCAAAVVARFGGRAYYLYAGSTGEHRDANPAYAALWAGIKAAAQAGCRDFDLWGVAPSDQPNHPWAGLSVFKRGFGADEVEYVGCWEIIFDPSGARVLSTLEATRRLARRLR